VKQHVAKTGDLDAILVMWTTFYTLIFLHLLITPGARKTLIIWTGAGIACAFLSKGIAGFVPAAGLGVCVVLAGKLKWIVSRKETYLSALIIAAVCIGYYVLRESLAPGFFDRTSSVDFGRFTTDYMAWHHHRWYYYVRNWFMLDFFTPYAYWLPVAIATACAFAKYRQPTVMLTPLAFVFVAVFSYPKVKLMWYDAPVYPWLALICATGFLALWDFLIQRFHMNTRAAQWLFAVALVVIFAIPVINMYERNAELYLPVDPMEHEGFFIRELSRDKPEVKNYIVLMMAEQNAHFTQLDFYLNAYNRHKGFHLAHLRDTSDVRAGDTIAVCQERQYNWLIDNYLVEEIFNGETGCKLVVLD
jgi:4-amino-4-deoxy-L-arabinose transferase-like glycosyltransferase